MADWVPTNHKADEKEAARNRKKLMKIIKLPQNAICADCPIKRAAPHHPSIPAPPLPRAPSSLLLLIIPPRPHGAPTSASTRSRPYPSALPHGRTPAQPVRLPGCCAVAQNAWASINLGQFICFQCSGIHRNLGTHITKVRSLNLDSWNDDWVANMERWGNHRSAQYWEARIPPGVRRPTVEDSNQQNHVLKTFIKDKYQDRCWAAPERPAEWIQTNGGGSGAPPAQAAPARAPAPAASPAAVRAAPAPAPARVAVAASMPKPASGPDLFSFDEPVAAAPAPAAQDPFGSFETPAPQQAQGQGGFGDFGDSSGFGAAFNGGQAAPPADKKNDIMSMFNNSQPQQQQQMGGFGQPRPISRSGGAGTQAMPGWFSTEAWASTSAMVKAYAKSAAGEASSSGRRAHVSRANSSLAASCQGLGQGQGQGQG